LDWKTTVTISITVLLALGGYLATYVNNVRLAQHKDRLERVNRQLSEFYGPLFALTRSTSASWAAFRSKYRPDVQSYWDSRSPATSEEAAVWRLWITEVFMPLDVQMAEIVVQKADLLDEAEMPQCLLDLCAHVAAYRALLKRWEEGDFSEHKSILLFPEAALREYTSTSFSRLKTRQQDLLTRLFGHDS
jgi:hypothetical protein